MTQRSISQVLFTVLVLSLWSPWAQARPHQAIDSVEALDEQIEACLNYLGQGDIQQARLLARQIAWRFPDFALGQLISADLESTAAFRDVAIADHMSVAHNVSKLLLEARQRLSAKQSNTPDLKASPSSDISSPHSLPGDLVQIGAHLSQLVVVDLNSSILYQYETAHEQANLVRQHYIGSGEAGFGKRLEGDLKTPLGIYSVDGYHSDDALPDLYGAGALTLDYPNALDHYLDRTGYGIWLHGVPRNQLSRTPYSSEGCVTMSNEHLTRLSSSLDSIGTRVILTQNVTPLEPDERAELQKRFRNMFTQYQRAWINADEGALKALYQDEQTLEQLLASGNNGLMQVENIDGIEATTRFNHSLYRYAFSNIKSEDISIFRNPDTHQGDPDAVARMVISATFGDANEHEITLYWAQSDSGEWQVLTETLKSTGTGL